MKKKKNNKFIKQIILINCNQDFLIFKYNLLVIIIVNKNQ